MAKNRVPEALDILRDAWKKDPSFRDTYKANLAMCFRDALEKEGFHFPQAGIITNDGAERFLQMLERK